MRQKSPCTRVSVCQMDPGDHHSRCDSKLPKLASPPCWEGAASAVLARSVCSHHSSCLASLLDRKLGKGAGSGSFLLVWEVEMLQNNLCKRLCLVLPLWLLMFHTARSVSGSYFGREYIW